MLSKEQQQTLTNHYKVTLDVLLNAAMDQTSGTQLVPMPARHEQLGLVSQVVALKCVVLKQVPDIISVINREEADTANELYHWILRQLTDTCRMARRSVRAALKMLPTNADIATKLCA